MPNKLKTISLALVLAVLVAVFQTGHTSAASGVIYLSPSSASVQVGNQVSFSLRISPGGSVNTVEAVVNYNSSQLEFVSSNPSAFPACPQNSGSGGTVNIACANLGGEVTTDSLISTITFKALASSGTASLSLSGVNAADNGTYTNPTSSGATVSFSLPPQTAPAPSPTPTKTVNTPSSAKSKTSTPAPTPTQTVTAPPAPAKVSASLGGVQFTTATIKITTNTPVKAYIEYGTDLNNLNLKTEAISITKSGSIGLPSSQLNPGTTYFYRVVTVDPAGVLTPGVVRSLATKGYSLKIKVLDSNYRPVANQIVTLHSLPMVAKTDSAGIATFSNVAPGPHHVEYSLGKKTYTGSLYVANNYTTSKNGQQTAPSQVSAAVLDGYQLPAEASPPWLAIILVAIGGVLLSFMVHDFDTMAPKLGTWGELASIKLRAKAELALIRLSLKNSRAPVTTPVKTSPTPKARTTKSKS